VISGVTLSNTLSTGLGGEEFASNSLIAELTSSTYALDALDLSEAQQNRVLDVYMLGLHYIFIFYTVCAGLSLVLTSWIGNTSLKAPKAAEDDTETAVEENSVPTLPEQSDRRVTTINSGNDPEKGSRV
jgi:hypothetical protein